MPLEGELVVLREERPEDLDIMTMLRNDLETQAWGKTLPPDYTQSMLMKRFEAREFSFERSEGLFVIASKESGEVAGRISYMNLRPRWSCVIGIMLAKKFWGSGFGFDAQEVLLKFLFQELGLRVVRLYTNSSNPRAVRLAERSGFNISVRQRQAAFRNGQLCDNLMLDLLREEYFALHPDHVDHLPPLSGDAG
jgi:RimJ/RimL family protein N-acetyltransferase